MSLKKCSTQQVSEQESTFVTILRGRRLSGGVPVVPWRIVTVPVSAPTNVFCVRASESSDYIWRYTNYFTHSLTHLLGSECRYVFMYVCMFIYMYVLLSSLKLSFW